MKVFQGKSWGSKVNFVDDNNVLVGYDTSQSCCEHADWFIMNSIHHDTNKSNNGYEEAAQELEGYNFDTEFFEESNAGCYDGAMAIFKLVNETNSGVKYLHLFNVHNGYYGHGFEMTVNGGRLHDGTL